MPKQRPHYAFFDGEGLRLYAHRGGNEGGPENSMSAFQAAVDRGYRRLETDVVRTLDGQLVAMHAVNKPAQAIKTGLPTLGFIEEYGLDDARRKLGMDEDTLPLFEDLIRTFPDALFNVDPKHNNAIGLLAAAITNDNVERFNVGSFSYKRTMAVAEEVGRVGSQLRLSAAVSVLGGISAVLPLRAGLPYLQSVEASCVQTSKVGVRRGVVNVVEAAGLELDVWTVNNRETMELMIDIGAGGIMSDETTLLQEVAGARAERFSS